MTMADFRGPGLKDEELAYGGAEAEPEPLFMLELLFGRGTGYSSHGVTSSTGPVEVERAMPAEEVRDLTEGAVGG